MADFCKQCSMELFGYDSRDLSTSDLAEDGLFYCICEGCGPTAVKKDGTCVGDCLRGHGGSKGLKAKVTISPGKLQIIPDEPKKIR